MLTQEEVKFLVEFCATRPLDGLNLLYTQKLTAILMKLQKSIEQSGGD